MKKENFSRFFFSRIFYITLKLLDYPSDDKKISMNFDGRNQIQHVILHIDETYQIRAPSATASIIFRFTHYDVKCVI